jgi:hypothetical protein
MPLGGQDEAAPMRRHIDKRTWSEIRTAYASGIGLRAGMNRLGVLR